MSVFITSKKTKIMKTESILKADVLDIIFENRNKSYGAYTLRKFYNNRLYKALGLTFLFVGFLCSFTLINSKDVVPDIPTIDDVILAQVIHDVKAPEKPKEPLVKPREATTANSNIKTDNLSTSLITKKADVAKINTIDFNTTIDNKISKGTDGAIFKIKSTPSAFIDSGKGFVEPKKPEIDRVTPTDFADVMPQYPGGMTAFRKFLENNLKNPQDLEEGEKVAVKIKFIVGYDGELKGFETIEDGGTSFNNEVIRVLKKMPNWIPGKMRGENVSVYYTVPVKFVSEN